MTDWPIWCVYLAMAGAAMVMTKLSTAIANDKRGECPDGDAAWDVVARIFALAEVLISFAAFVHLMLAGGHAILANVMGWGR